MVAYLDGLTLRWLSLYAKTINKEPFLSAKKVFIYEFFWISYIVLCIGIYGGITVIFVELFAVFCETPISLPPSTWIGIGAAVASVLLPVPCALLYAHKNSR
jgi:hypothetical protein